MCGGDCGPIRCAGCPETDWSAFTWQWDAPGSVGVLDAGSSIERFFLPNSRRMIHPGNCPCLWLVGGGDYGRDLVGTYNTAMIDYPIPSVGALSFRRNGNQGQWMLQLSRWAFAYGWDIGNADFYGYGWGWDDAAIDAGENCDNRYPNPYRYGYYWGGYGGFGFNGWGWAYGGYYAYGALWGDAGARLYAVTYDLEPGVRMNCKGTNRFYLRYPEDMTGFDADAWPAFVDITRVQK